MELVVVHIPGLSARMLLERPVPALTGMDAATLVNIDGASPSQQEAALLCGLAPEHLGAFGGGVGESRIEPFWVRACAKRPDLRCRVQTPLPLPNQWRRADAQPHFQWLTLALQRDDLPALEPAIVDLVRGAAAAVVLSAWSWAGESVAPQSCAPQDRPVVLWRGPELAKSTVGILEIAGWLERALTHEVIRDEV